MAVRFKVPASPKKNVYAIDEFYGVDLTNIGPSIDDTRSPNAENMVRWTPGKVRKRTGYKTKIQYMDTEDVNRVKHSSNEWADYTETLAENPNQIFFELWDKFITYEKWGGAKTEYHCFFYLDCDIKGKYDILFDFADEKPEASSNGYTYRIRVDGTRTTPIVLYDFYFEYGVALYTGLSQIRVVRYASTSDEHFRVKNMRVCYNTKASNSEEWAAMDWTPAPEDVDIVPYLKYPSSYINGCHIFKAPGFTGNRVVNVNRVLGTSDEWTEFSISRYSDTFLYDIADMFYAKYSGYYLVNKACVRVSFDYISNQYVTLLFKGEREIPGYYDTIERDLENYHTNDLVSSYNHVEFWIRLGSTYRSQIFAKTTRADSGWLKIRNMSIVYDMNDDFEWSTAPEDNGGEFNYEDIYNIEPTNYSIINSNYFEITSDMAVKEGEIYIQDSDPEFAPTPVLKRGFFKIGLDLTIESINSFNTITISVWDQFFETGIREKVLTRLPNRQHIEFYGCTKYDYDVDRYVEKIKIEIETTDSQAEFAVTAENITLQLITPKKIYDKAEKNYIYTLRGQIYMRPDGCRDIVHLYREFLNRYNTIRSKAWQLNNKLIICDGMALSAYSAGREDVDEIARNDGECAETNYIPLVTIAKNPNGGGVPYEPFNLVQSGFYEQFIVDSASATATDFYLSFNDIKDQVVKVWVLNENGVWELKKRIVDYTVDSFIGVIHFLTPPGVTPISGEDNVRILAYKEHPDYVKRIANCQVGILYGVNGETDRLFLSGNPDYPNWDFFSAQNDPTYFPDTNYCVLGSEVGNIIGYTRIGNYLATFKDEPDNSQVVFIRTGELQALDESGLTTAVFKNINKLQGEPVISPDAFGYLQTEPVFLTKKGIYALTLQDITGERYSQSRSFYLDGALEKERDLYRGCATVFDNQYFLAVNDKLYILDGLQASRSDRSEPYSTRQYAGFICTGIPAHTIWEDEDALWIGTKRGQICRFDTDIESSESYNDDGEPIYCCWETPDLDGHLFYKNKSFRYLALRMMASIRTSVKIFSRKLGNWSFIKEDRSTGTWFDFKHIDFEFFSFNTDRSERVAHTKVRVKKVDKARFRIENGRLNEPFGLVDLALEYIENGNYKG